MFSLRQFLEHVARWNPQQVQSDELFCTEADARRTMLVNRMREAFAGYSFTLILDGELTLLYRDREVVLSPDDLFIYSPGFQYRILHATADYHSMVLISDEQMTMEVPVTRGLVRAAYIPLASYEVPLFKLSADEANHLLRLMQMIRDYMQQSGRFRDERLRILYSLFLLDLMEVIQYSAGHAPVSEHTAELFVQFVRLASQHFAEHHDVGFYASELCITPTHLQRVIHQMAGRTVVEHIDRLLFIEAAWLLRTTDLSVAAVAARLNFAHQSSFTKFFVRMRGCTPREYRVMAPAY